MPPRHAVNPSLGAPLFGIHASDGSRQHAAPSCFQALRGSRFFPQLHEMVEGQSGSGVQPPSRGFPCAGKNRISARTV